MCVYVIGMVHKEIEVIPQRCSKCHSAQTYRSLKRMVRVCRYCGNEDKIKITEVKK